MNSTIIDRSKIKQYNKSMMECVNDVVEKSFEAGKSSTDYVNFLGFNDVGLTNFNLAGSFNGQDMSIIKTTLTILTSEDFVLDTTSDGYVLKFTSYNGDSVESTFRYDIFLKSEYDDDGNKSYVPCDPVKESVYEY